MQTDEHRRRALTPAELTALAAADPGLRLLDVRTPGEHASMHIRGAYNVPLDTLGEHAAEIRAVRAPLVLVCQSGQRARTADATLQAAGLDNLFLLDGGMNAWLAAGLPVVRGNAKMSLERQVRIAAGTLAALGGLLGALVDPAFGWLAAFVGSGLVFAGVSDTCGMAMLLAKLPYNRPASCDVASVVRALADGRETPGTTAPSRTPRTCCG